MLAADGPRYKAIGNSMAIPVMRWIGDRITKAVCRQKEGSETKERKVKPAAEFERSIFKWAGGKFGVLEQIFRYLPEGKRLIEPFVGGGAVFMNAGYQENLLNDVNADLINFYKTLQREAHSLITLAHRFFQDYNTQEGYLAVRNAFNKQVYDDLHRAAAFLFLNRHCFNGLTRYNQAGEFNVGYGKYKTPYFPLQEMEAFLAPGDAVIDATHPYAVEVSANIRGACLRTGKKCLRLLRERGNTEGAVLCASLPEAAALAGEAEGNILAATGSKEISLYSAIPEFATRVYARVLPTDSSVRACREAGLSDSHILAARGPFSLEQNLWTLKRYSIKSLVTKDGGDAGGFAAKAEAARQTGCTLYVVRRPEESGLTPAEVENLLKEGL